MRAIRVTSLALLGTAVFAVGAPGALADENGGGGGLGADLTSFRFTVVPERVAPGGTVTLSATECLAPAVTASSPAFETVTLGAGTPATVRIPLTARPGTTYGVIFDCQGEHGLARLMVAPADTALQRRVDSTTPRRAGGGGQADPGIPGVPGVPGMPHATGVSRVSDVPVVPELPEAPALPPGPDGSVLPELPTEPGPDPEAADPGGYPDGGGEQYARSDERFPSAPVKPDGGVRAGGGGLSGPSAAQTGVGLALVAGAVGGAGVLLRRSRHGG
ncbi:hypothetical protein ACFVIM_35075 [Streptomyces sp. NPDC057638]|uniref:hypothetical protein n=1 Tax=Streptomyces sp. NPDC057638 TaxID=3346190 RepID=UPI00367F2E6C